MHDFAHDLKLAIASLPKYGRTFSFVSMQEFASNYLFLLLLLLLTAFSFFLLSFLKEEEDSRPWKPPVRREVATTAVQADVAKVPSEVPMVSKRRDRIAGEDGKEHKATR